MSTIGNNIAHYRKLKGITQSDLAVRMKVSSTTVSAWELGRNEPSMGSMIKLADIFEIDVNELAGACSVKHDSFSPTDMVMVSEITELITAWAGADATTREMVWRILRK